MGDDRDPFDPGVGKLRLQRRCERVGRGHGRPVVGVVKTEHAMSLKGEGRGELVPEVAWLVEAVHKQDRRRGIL